MLDEESDASWINLQQLQGAIHSKKCMKQLRKHHSLLKPQILVGDHTLERTAPNIEMAHVTVSSHKESLGFLQIPRTRIWMLLQV